MSTVGNLVKRPGYNSHLNLKVPEQHLLCQVYFDTYPPQFLPNRALSQVRKEDKIRQIMGSVLSFKFGQIWWVVNFSNLLSNLKILT